MLRTWVRSLFNRPAVRNVAAPTRRRDLRLLLSALEDRTVPAVNVTNLGGNITVLLDNAADIATIRPNGADLEVFDGTTVKLTIPQANVLNLAVSRDPALLTGGTVTFQGKLDLTAATVSATKIATINGTVDSLTVLNDITFSADNALSYAFPLKSTAGAISLTSATGDVTLSSTITAATMVTIRAPAGSIIDGNVGNDITTSKLALLAKSGIGAGGAIDTTVAILEADVATSGDINVTNTGPLAIGGVTASATGVNTKSGSITVLVTAGGFTANTAGESVTATGTITITSDSITLAQPVNAGATGCVILQPLNAATKIDLGGTDVAGTLGIDAKDLAQITTGILQIGNTTNTGGITQTDALDLSIVTTTLDLRSKGSITQNAGKTITVANLVFQAGGNVSYTQANDVTNLAAKAVAGGAGTTFKYTDANDVAIASILVCDGTISGISQAGQTVTITSTAGGIADANPNNPDVLATSLILSASNAIGGLNTLIDLPVVPAGSALETTVTNLEAAVTTAGDIGIVNSTNLNIGAGTAVAGVNTADGNVIVTANGTLSVTTSGETIKATGTVTAISTGDITTGGSNGVANGAINSTGGLVTVRSTNGNINLGVVPFIFGDVRGVGVSIEAKGDVVIDASTFVDDVTAAKVGVTIVAGGNFTMTGAGPTRVTSQGGPISVTAKSDTISTIGTGNGFQSNGGTITLTADKMALGQVVNASATGCVILQPFTNATTIDLGGADAAGVLGLLDAELDLVTASVLQIGKATSGAITVSAAISPANAPTLHLVSVGNISGASPITVTSLALSSGGLVNLSGDNAVTNLAGTSVGNFNFRTAATLKLNVGTVNVCPPMVVTGITATGGDVTITADDLEIAAAINAGTKCVILQPTTDGRTIALGGEVAGSLSLKDSELDLVTASVLQIGRALAGAISVVGAISPANAATLHLSSAGNIAGAFAITVTSLAATSGGLVNLSGDNVVTNLAGSAATSFNFREAAGLKLNVTAVNVCPPTVVTGITATNGDVTITADDLEITAAINAGTKCAILQPTTDGRTITLGGEVAGSLSLKDSELDFVTAGVLQIGRALAGAITIIGAVIPANTATLHLSSAGDIAGAAAINVTNLAVTSGGLVNLSGLNVVTNLAGSAATTFSFREAVGLKLNVTTVNVCPPTVVTGITTTNGDITITADDLEVIQAIKAGTKCVILQPTTDGRTIALGGEVAGSLSLKDSELDLVTGSVLQIGRALAGAITLVGPISPANAATLHLSSGGDIAGAFAITVTNLAATSGGLVNLSGLNVVTNLAGSAATSFSFREAAGLKLNVTTVNVCPPTVVTGVTTTNGDITITADDLEIAAAINAGTKCVVIQPTTDGRTITLGGEVAGSLSLKDSELDLVTASVLQIGRALAGAITVVGVISPANAATLHLSSAGDIAGAFAITVTNLAATSGGLVNLSGLNVVTNLAGSAATTFSFREAAGLKLNVTTVNVCPPTVVTGITTTNGDITITADDLEIVAAINAGTKCVILQPTTDGRTIALGGEVAGSLSLKDSELDLVTASVLQIGRALAGAITVVGPISPANAATLHLSSAGDIAGASPITVTSLAVTSGGLVNLSGLNVVTNLAGTAATTFSFREAAGLKLNVTTVNVCPPTVVVGITTANGDITITADDLEIIQAINAGTKCVILQPTTDGRTITLGGEVAGSLSLKDSELDLVTASVLQIGRALAGAITLVGPISPANAATLHLSSAGDIAGAFAITVTNLAVTSGGLVNLSGDNVVTNLAGSAATTFTFREAANLKLNVTTVNVCPPTVVTGITTTNGDITITADDLEIIAAINAGTKCVILQPTTDGSTITLGGEVAGSLSLKDSELDLVTAGVLQIGRAGAGAITIVGALNPANAAILHLNSAGDIAGAVVITVTNLAVTSGGLVNLSGDNVVTNLAGSAATTFSFREAAGLKLNVTTVNVCPPTVVTGIKTTNGDITITADDLEIVAAINAGTKCVILQPTTDGRTITLGGEVAGSLSLKDSELDLVTAGVLQVGRAAAGAITVAGAISPANAATLHLSSAGDITGAAITVTNLAVTSGGLVNLSGDNVVTNLAGSAATSFTFREAATLKLNITTVNVCPPTVVVGITTTNGDITITADDLEIDAAINAGAKCVILQPTTDARQTSLGGEVAGTLSLKDVELDFITAKVLQIGKDTNAAATITPASGTITVVGAVTLANAKVPTLHLVSTGNIAGTFPITVTNLAVNAGGFVSLTGLNVVTTLAGTSVGAFAFTEAAATLLTVGTLAVCPPNADVVGITAGGDITITADDLEIVNPVTTPTCVVLQPTTDAVQTSLGGEVAGTLSLKDSELDLITAKVLQIGKDTNAGAAIVPASGTITIVGAVSLANAKVPTLHLVSAGNIAGTNPITVTNLAVNAGGFVSLTGANVVTTLAGTSGGAFTFVEAGTLSCIGVVPVCPPNADVTGINAGGDITITADDIEIKSPTITPTCVILQPLTDARQTSLGGEVAGTLSLKDSELDLITAKVLQIGKDSNAGAAIAPASGTITIVGAVSLANAKVPTLHLVSKVDIIGVNPISVTNLAVNSGGIVSLTAANVVTTLAGTSGGAFTFVETAGMLLCIGTVPVCPPNADVTGITAGGDITITADDIEIKNNVTTPACVILQPTTDARPTSLGGEVAGTLSLKDSELDFITAKVLQIGKDSDPTAVIAAASGAITFVGAASLAAAKVPTLHLISTGDVSANGAGTIAVQNLAITALQSVNLPNANDVTRLAGIAGPPATTKGLTQRDFIFVDAVGGLEINTVTVCNTTVSDVVSTTGNVTLKSNGGGAFAINGNITAKYDVDQIDNCRDFAINLTSNGPATQAAGKSILARILNLSGTGSFKLDSAINDVDRLSANVTGFVTFVDDNKLAVSAQNGFPGAVKTANSAVNITTGLGFGLDISGTIDVGASSVTITFGLDDAGPAGSAGSNVEIYGVTVATGGGFTLVGNSFSNRFAIRPSPNAAFLVLGNDPVLPLGPNQPGDSLEQRLTLDPMQAATSLNVLSDSKDGTDGRIVFLNPNAALTPRTITFKSIENQQGRSLLAYAVETVNKLANGKEQASFELDIQLTLGNAKQGSTLRVTLPTTAPFIAAPAFRNPVAPFAAPQLSIGDFNGDGFADLALAFGSDNAPLVTLFDGRAISKKLEDANAALLAGMPFTPTLGEGDILAQFFAYNPNFFGGVFISSGDIDGKADSDGRFRDEIVTGAGAGGGPHVRVFRLSNVRDPLNPNLVRFRVDTVAGSRGSFYAYNPSFLGGVRVSVGDVDGNGTPDIVTGAGPGGGPHVKTFYLSAAADGTLNPSAKGDAGFYAYDSTFTGGVFIDAGDFNNDNKADILTGAGFGGGPHVKVFSGANVGNFPAPTLLKSFFDQQEVPQNKSSTNAEYAAYLRSGVSSVAFGFFNTDPQTDILVGIGLGRRAQGSAYTNPMNLEMERFTNPNFLIYRRGVHIAQSSGVDGTFGNDVLNLFGIFVGC